MASFLGLILLMLAALLALLMLAQGLRGSVDLLSVRNFFLLGFIVFQLTSGWLALGKDNTGDYAIQNPAGTGLVYVTMVMIFLAIMLTTYNRGWFVKWLARKTPTGNATPGTISLVTLAMMFLLVGMVMRLVLVYIPILGVLTGMAAVGLLAVAAGAIAWAWSPRIMNPILAVIAGVILLAALGTSMHKSFGRRDILSVLVCFLWGAYHGYWRWLGPMRSMAWIGGVGFAGLLFVAGVTAIRSGDDRDRSGTEMLQRVAGANFKEGLYDVAGGQQAALNSMWLIENYPQAFPYQPFGTLVYIFVNPIPREFWPDKPEALGRTAVFQANADRKRLANYTIGPGLMGHIAADNPWLTLIPYAVLLGLFFRYLDEMVRLHPTNPFVVLPVGVALGQFIGLPRGDAGLFMFYALICISAAWVGMFAVARTMAFLGWRMTEEAAPDGAYDGYGDDGAWAGEEPDYIDHDAQDTYGEYEHQPHA